MFLEAEIKEIFLELPLLHRKYSNILSSEWLPVVEEAWTGLSFQEKKGKIKDLFAQAENKRKKEHLEVLADKKEREGKKKKDQAIPGYSSYEQFKILEFYEDPEVFDAECLEAEQEAWTKYHQRPSVETALQSLLLTPELWKCHKHMLKSEWLPAVEEAWKNLTLREILDRLKALLVRLEEKRKK